MWTGLSNSLASDSPVPGPFFACVLWPPGCSPVSFASPKTLSSLHPLLHRHPGEGRRRFTTAKLVIQRLALRSPLEAGFVTASYLPVCSRDRAAYATGVSFAYRHASHVLFASRKSLSPLPPLPTSSSRRRPGSSALRLVVLQSGIRDGLVLACVSPRPGRLRSGRFTRLPASESLSLCWPKEKVTKEKWPQITSSEQH